VQKPRAVGLLPVCLTVKPVGEPDALIGHVRFDERGWETERCRMAQATAPILDSTGTDHARCLLSSRYRGVSGLIADHVATAVFDPTRTLPAAAPARSALISHRLIRSPRRERPC
jgi:hypothetical protein